MSTILYINFLQTERGVKLIIMMMMMMMMIMNKIKQAIMERNQ